MRSRLKVTLIQIIISILFLEGGLRIIDLFEPFESESGVQIYEQRGENYFAKPNIQIDKEVLGRKITISTNAFGMNWKPVKKLKRKGVKRIGFYGDSFTFGLWASDHDKSFVGVINQKLASESIEILNFGCPGFGIDNIHDLIKGTAEEFDLDIVVLCSYNGNDLRDTYLGMDKTIIKNGATEVNHKVLDDKIPGYKESRMNLKNVLRNNIYILKYYSLVRGLFSTPAKNPMFLPSTNPLSYSYWSSTEDSEIKRNAVKRSIDEFSKIINFCKSDKRDMKLHFIAIPYKDQVYVKEEQTEKYDINYPQNYFKEYCKNTGVPFFDLNKNLRAYLEEHEEETIYDYSHFNDHGHSISGELISDYLSKVEKEYITAQ